MRCYNVTTNKSQILIMLMLLQLYKTKRNKSKKQKTFHDKKKKNMKTMSLQFCQMLSWLSSVIDIEPKYHDWCMTFHMKLMNYTGGTHNSANLTFEMLSSTSNGVMSPITTTLLLSKSTSNDVTPTNLHITKSFCYIIYIIPLFF